jgi:hypothetical protein
LRGIDPATSTVPIIRFVARRNQMLQLRRTEARFGDQFKPFGA